MGEGDGEGSFLTCFSGVVNLFGKNIDYNHGLNAYKYLSYIRIETLKIYPQSYQTNISNGMNVLDALILCIGL